jgi:hypothetical protein
MYVGILDSARIYWRAVPPIRVALLKPLKAAGSLTITQRFSALALSVGSPRCSDMSEVG